mgnify:CR=1 FL=1
MSTSMQALGVEEFVKARSSTDESNIYMEWQGSIYAFVPQEKQRKLFDIIGMNVSRCFRGNDNKWYLASRELTFYLDPQTGQVLEQWENPWTQELVTVVHVTINPFQLVLAEEYPVFLSGKNVTFVIDIPLTYPNVLGNDPKFQDYSPQSLYQAGEFFQYTVPIEEITDTSKVTTDSFSGSWMRLGPWLPWMKMKDYSGNLVYNASIRKYRNFEELSPILQQFVKSRLPVYKEAPSGFVEGKNETSWTYFRKHFDKYLQGAQFPLPEA